MNPLKSVKSRGHNFLVLFATVLLGMSSLARCGELDGVVRKESIIEALRPKPRVMTRGLRNLKVEPAPSVSLTIRFEFDSAQLSEDSAQQLEQLSAALNSDDLKTLGFLIEGHTDAKGQPAYNLRLSERRAEAVRAFLVGQGANHQNLSATGRGSSDLADPDHPWSGVNRRVKIVTIDAN